MLNGRHSNILLETQFAEKKYSICLGLDLQLRYNLQSLEIVYKSKLSQRFRIWFR